MQIGDRWLYYSTAHTFLTSFPRNPRPSLSLLQPWRPTYLPWSSQARSTSGSSRLLLPLPETLLSRIATWLKPWLLSGVCLYGTLFLFSILLNCLIIFYIFESLDIHVILDSLLPFEGQLHEQRDSLYYNNLSTWGKCSWMNKWKNITRASLGLGNRVNCVAKVSIYKMGCRHH